MSGHWFADGCGIWHYSDSLPKAKKRKFILTWTGYTTPRDAKEFTDIKLARQAMVAALQEDVKRARQVGWQPHYDRTSDDTGEVRAGADRRCPLWSRCGIATI